MASDVYYHGGAPGLRPHRSILPAAKLRLVFDYGKPYILSNYSYDPNLVYLTTHLGAARGYAARYLPKEGEPIPGDVYEVRPVDTPAPDPDYKELGVKGIFVRCREAKIVRVVERGVELDVREQNQDAWPYTLWGPNTPMFTEDGQMIASDQMRESGVSQDYMRLLPKWVGVSEVGSEGRVSPKTVKGFPVEELVDQYVDQVLDFFAHIPLARVGHQIEAQHHGGDVEYMCSCGWCCDDRDMAARHQSAETELQLIIDHNLYAVPIPGDPFDHALVKLADKGDPRWAWYSHEQAR